MFVRVKDPATKHEFDVPETDWRLKAGIFTRIKPDRYPPVSRPRRAKHYINWKKKTAPAVDVKETENG
ncbi:hypothetical protein [Saccharomonospora viridis]|uniref:hypothetical protein n=1 Tax=Saccharomonospora viridis TaxID=1852 RepID=UPI00240A3C08|nr:hypothetical protein [Saccharomonospora viridis]